MTRIETLSIVQKDLRILLAMKKKKFGAGRWNGFGGGMTEFDNTVHDTNLRETKEEAGIILINPVRMGRILFHFQTDEQDHDVHFFKARSYTGNPEEGREMIPKWFNINEIPYDQMWTDDRYWLPVLLRDNYFLGDFTFNPKHQIVYYTLREMGNQQYFEDTLSTL